MDSLGGHAADFYYGEYDLLQAGDMHAHDFLELAYVKSGGVWHSCDGRRQYIAAGNYLIIDYSVSHCYEKVEAGTCIVNCIFRPGFIDSTLRGCRRFDDVARHYWFRMDDGFRFRAHNGEAFADEHGIVRGLLEGIGMEYCERRPAYRSMIRARLIQILVETLRKLPEQPKPERGDPVSYICDQIDRLYGEKLRLEDFAQELHLHPAYLSRKFTALCGESFLQRLQGIRMRAACRLLAETDKKCQEIAETVGYHDIQFFNRVFRRYTGLSPSAYRSANRR